MSNEDKKILINDSLHSVTPEIIAEMFAELCADEQAAFFNHVDKVASTWGDGGLFPFQMQAITDENGLTLAGRRVMQYIGEYSHWGLVPRVKGE